MKELIKVRDISLKYDISARALKYYEDMMKKAINIFIRLHLLIILKIIDLSQGMA